MTFIVNNSLSIEIFDLIKSRGSKITVYKELQLRMKPRQELDEEPGHELHSLAFPTKDWEDGWNFAECHDDVDPIPMIVCTGHSAGPGMFHAWLEPPKHHDCIPFEGRLEDFHFAGRADWQNFSLIGIPDKSNTHIHLGFKKLYLYKTDRELGIKMLLEKPPKMFDGFGSSYINLPHYQQGQQFQTQQLQAALNQAHSIPGHLLGTNTGRITASMIRAQQNAFGRQSFQHPQPGDVISIPANSGGTVSVSGKQVTTGIDFANQDTRGSSKAERVRRVLERLGGKFLTPGRSTKPDHS